MDFCEPEKRTKTFVWFVAVKILFLFSLLPATINAQETFPRRNAIVAAVEKVGSAVANLSTEKLQFERRIDPFFGYRNDLFDQCFLQDSQK